MPTTIAELRDNTTSLALRRQSLALMRNHPVFPRRTRGAAAVWASRSNLGLVVASAKFLMEELDAFIDGDAPTDHDPAWHLAHMLACLEALRPQGERVLSGSNLVAQPYDCWLVTVVRLSEELGRPLLPLLLDAWANYAVEANAMIGGIRFQDDATYAAGLRSYTVVRVAQHYVLGAPYDQSVALAATFQEPYYRLLAVRSFPQSLAKCQLKVRGQALVASGVDLNHLLKITEEGCLGPIELKLTWEKLASYGPFVNWYRSEIEAIRVLWGGPHGGHAALRELANLLPTPWRQIMKARAELLGNDVNFALSAKGANRLAPITV